jgi:NAD(P)-dependent dehydrogenase (short-subunit alcohol dehydrogenase family)
MNADEKRTAFGLALVAGGLTALGIANQRHAHKRRFRDQVVAITGGSRGLGLEMARVWLSEGARVAVCARDRTELQRAASILKVGPDRLMTHVCDVRDREQAQDFVRYVEQSWGRIDVLVNNAGTIQVGPWESMDIADFENAMATHFWGPLFMTLAALPGMLRRGRGNIANIASIGGEIGVPHLAPYCASKFALVGLSESLQVELRQDGIQVTTICPGLMRTGSHRNAQFKGDHRAEYTWFSISGALPVASMNSARAARQIVDAVRKDQSFVRLSLPARVTVPARTLFSAWFSTVASWANRLLPASVNTEMKAKKGFESESRWSPSILTRLSDRAALRNNEHF